MTNYLSSAISLTQTIGLSSCLAFLCDDEGQVREVYQDGQGLIDHHIVGQPFAAILDSGSVDKAALFLTTVQHQSLVCDWELDVVVAGQPQLFYFMGVTIADGLLIVGADGRADMLHYCHELMRSNSAYSHLIDSMLEEQSLQVREREAQDYMLYNELSRLNNEAVTAQRELAQKNAQLAELIQQKNELIGMIVHDLRSPLSAIGIFSHVLMESGATLSPEEQSNILTTIYENSQATLHFINDLLDVTAIEAGKLKMGLVPTQLAPLLEQVVNLHRMLAQRKQIELVLHCEADLPEVEVDSKKIQQVVENLISNAIKFSLPNTTIEVRVTRRQEEIEIVVQDEGQGIPATEVKRLFQPFSKLSVKPTGGETSRGLGLAIVRKFVEGHQGRVWVESQVNQGSTFYISLPLRPATPKETYSSARYNR
jgi:signal transduction histidine kinase